MRVKVKKKYINKLKNTIDQSITRLEQNSKEIEEVLEKITQTDKKKLSDSEKTDLDRLTQELNDIDNVIGNILNGRF